MHETGPGSRHESSERAVFNIFAQDFWGCTVLLFCELRLLKRRDEDKPVLQQVLQLVVCWWEE